MKDALAIHRMLLERETLHEIVRLPRSIANADELPKALGLPNGRCVATRVYSVSAVPSDGPAPLRPGRAKGTRLLAAVLVRAQAGSAAEAVRTALGARSARPAPADLINKVTDYAANLVAPLLLPDSMPLFVDEALTAELGPDDVVYTAAGEARTALGIKALDLFAICGAKPLVVRRPVDPKRPRRPVVRRVATT